ncbi:hypothetical protein ONE63_004123 [Megalurothrips usitatus]|uniref:Presequence protease, mitochondrial n=1 Tax=Megalurothrips usitatus TaxID=439358 RepID=A0AAV7X1V2_9NEOP|nr:hypothetical protein ONE63_004123 [Megalurothrips usitatus]
MVEMAPLDSSSIQPVENNFELLCSLKCNNLIPVSKYRSPRTGLTVVIASVEGPVVKGYFTVATEATDDDGLPHTLEHLVFLGSEQYPYKGVLDLLANRCLASGTNAWTDTDHTCYTMMTAGSEGFLTLMPIYVDHILYPLLNDSGFVTEVHHITGKGEDAGVVYCEMQGRENSGESLTYTEMKRAMYPEPCGYRYDEGGIMKNLRESCSNVKVRDYHKKYYRPENLTLIIAGQVKPEDVFAALAPIESKIVSKGDRGAFEKPWLNPIPPFPSSVDKEVPYPCDEEDNGMVFVGWRGPSAVTDLYGITACCLLLKYLCDTSASPLQQEFVENDDPCASNVSFSLAENKEAMIYMIFSNVPVDKLDVIKSKLDARLKKFVDKEERIEMSRMETVINRHRQETLSHLETNPHDAVAFMVIADMLYGTNKEDLHQRLNILEILDKLVAEPESYWINLLNQYLLKNNCATIRGRPSQAERQRLSDDEEKRIEKQRQDLGPDGLKKFEKELEEAIAHNELPPPDAMLRSVAIPDASSINFHPIERFSSDSIQQHSNLPLDKVPIYTQVDHVHTNFVYLYLLMDTNSLSTELRPYLSLLIEAFLELPINEDGKLISYEDVVAELERDTVSSCSAIGVSGGSRFICGSFSSTAYISIQCEPAKFKKGIQWINKLLYKTVLDADRIKTIATKLVNDVARLKRNGSKIVSALMKGIRFAKESNHYAASLLRQQKFLTTLIEKLGNPEDAKAVVADLEKVRQIITSPSNIVLHMASNLNDLPTSVKPDSLVDILSGLLPNNVDTASKKLNVTPDWKLVCPPSESPNPSCAVGMGCIESAFLIQSIPCIKSPLDEDLAPLLVYLQYLSQLEGPMWKQIRGQGLSYSYSVFPTTHEGLLYLVLYRATNVVAAYKEARSILEGHLKDASSFDETLLESARSSLIFEIIHQERSVGQLVGQSILWYFKGVDQHYNSNLVKHIASVTADDMARVAPKYVPPLFKSENSRLTVVVHTSKAAEVASEFKELGVDTKVYATLEDSFLSQW